MVASVVVSQQAMAGLLDSHELPLAEIDQAVTMEIYAQPRPRPPGPP
jgi:hypothetical protein